MKSAEDRGKFYPGKTFPPAIRDFLDRLARSGASPNTVNGYRKDLAAFFRWFRETTGEELDPAKVTSVDLREYQSFMRTRGRRPNTVNRRLKAVKAWLRWAVDEGLAPRLPDFPKDAPQGRKAPQALERAEQNRLLRELEKEGDARDRALVRLMLSCGLRLSEACGLRTEDVSLDGKRAAVVVRSGKGGKWREIPLPPEARKALREWLAERERKGIRSEWLFPGKDPSEPLSPSAAWRAVKKYAWKARIPGLKPHVLRHTCATNMIRSGAALTEVAACLGHASLNAVMIYTRPGMADLARALERGEA
jgi:integrase/recombinase XerC